MLTAVRERSVACLDLDRSALVSKN